MMICPKCLKQYGDDIGFCSDDGARLRAFRDQTSQMLGRVLDGRWTIVDKIGEGGMGEVYRARQKAVDRLVAVKVLRLALASSEEYVSRFFREADIASSVAHPHFVSIYDFGQAAEDQLLYIAMELLEGESLAKRARRERIPLRAQIDIGRQVCAALAAAHEARIVHRDLKPDNIFLVDVPEGGPFIKVLDFGIAKDLDADSVTRTGQLFGTPEYMSPEQCDGKQGVDGRADLYALGCILYELLSAQSPFQRDSVIQTLLAQVSDEAKSFRALGIPVPPRLERFVLRLLEKNPDNRFGDAIEARRALDEILEDLTPAEEQAYATVSGSLSPRQNSAATVSYSDLGNPLRLEGILAEDAKSALAREAEKRRRVESERETIERSERTPWVAGVAAAAIVLALLAAGFVTLREPDAVATAVTAPSPMVIASVAGRIADAHALAGREASAQAATALARRGAIRVTTEATALVVGKPDEPPPTQRPRERPSEKPTADPLLTVRTQSSIESRFRKIQGDLLACYDRREDPAEQGTVRFALQIDPDGAVSRARVESPGIRSSAVVQCMQEIAKGVRFARADGPTNYTKQLTFQSARP